MTLPIFDQRLFTKTVLYMVHPRTSFPSVSVSVSWPLRGGHKRDASAGFLPVMSLCQQEVGKG